MRILVTGGAGYLGRHLVPLLVERGHFVRVLDRFLFDQDLTGLAGQSCEVVRGDVRRLDRQAGLLDGIEAVIHMAGLANDPSGDLNPEMTLDVNVDATKKLLESAEQHQVRRFVFVSCCSVYGQGVFAVLDEESPTNPVSTYGRSKLAAEEAVIKQTGASLEPVVARVATLFGWSPRMRFDLAVNQMTATAVRQGTITIYGGGNQWRPFMHVKDAARAVALLAEAPGETVAGEVFNVGGDDMNYRVSDLGHVVAGQFGGIPFEPAKGDEDVRSYRVRFDKIRRALGFTCQWTVQDGIREVREGLKDSSLDPFADCYFNARWMKRLLATPAQEGGEPVAARFIPLSRPILGPEEEEAVVRALRSGWLTTGARVHEFEGAFARVVGSAQAVATSSCTAALHLCLVDAGVKPGDEVITSPITWASTANTIVNMGARLVLADVQRDTLNLDPAALERAITDRTRAIIPVHMAGLPCDLDPIYALARARGIAVVEDAAHALGASYKGVPIGAYGEYACFSLYPIKNITAIEGGMITVRNEEHAKRLRLLSNNGMETSTWSRYSPDAAPAPPEVVRPGFKYHMPDVHAAIGLEQLKRFNSFMEARRRLVRMYLTVLQEIEEIRLPAVTDQVEHAWHLFIVRLRLDRLTKSRNEIAHSLRQENVGTGVHFLALHLHKYYRETLGLKPQDLPEATAASAEVLSLPLYPNLTDKNVRDVVDALKKVLHHARGKGGV